MYLSNKLLLKNELTKNRFIYRILSLTYDIFEYIGYKRKS